MHPTNKRERIKLKHLKDEVKTVKSKVTKDGTIWKKGLEALREWEQLDEVREHTGR